MRRLTPLVFILFGMALMGACTSTTPTTPGISPTLPPITPVTPVVPVAPVTPGVVTITPLGDLRTSEPQRFFFTVGPDLVARGTWTFDFGTGGVMSASPGSQATVVGNIYTVPGTYTIRARYEAAGNVLTGELQVDVK